MKLRIDDQEHDVSVSPPAADGARRVVVDGNEHRVESCAAPPDARCLVIDGRKVLFHVAASPDGTWVSFLGRTRLVRTPAPGLETENRKQKTTHRSPSASQAITPTFPSMVVAVLVQVGDEVRRGQELIVVSAMKMESRLTAPRAGRVKAIRAAVGASVKPGDELVELEPATGGTADE
ncbi:MAG: biotin/lipoyl-binding protein [Deltaproteobacteria bacterium]|nr:biotin/lipoyl-binding protein [Deltaproteobacteria bacterium]